MAWEAGAINGMVGGGAQAAIAAAARRNTAMGGVGGLGGLGEMEGPSDSSTSPNSSLLSSAPAGAVSGGPTSNTVGARPRKGRNVFRYDFVDAVGREGGAQKSRNMGLELAGVGGRLAQSGVC
ncbi:hypothetical protein D9619_011076 [Psilocybe cf. subviscida]|uniref:Uncharacterized protein n=1 Tax=Psilocybe cf. subviscida TaxID=2480587 RepID=A0A8H5B8M0_9AGAR|nr:hypothetical protein D9619_011076 [Psilocybe cf. subviscida]